MSLCLGYIPRRREDMTYLEEFVEVGKTVLEGIVCAVGEVFGRLGNFGGAHLTVSNGNFYQRKHGQLANEFEMKKFVGGKVSCLRSSC